jgi:hemoglobin/transferrin/lactoferrin receptor protein
MRFCWSCAVLVSGLSVGGAAWGQEPVQEASTAPQEERPKEPAEKEVLITAPSPLKEEALFDAPYSAHVLDSSDLRGRKQSRSTPEAFKEVPGVHVQRTGPAQASPVIRGMTGYHTLLLIDGIRLNNSAFRSGPNQYWATVDPFLVDRLEIIRGPASVLYGSDALGGTAYVHTLEPEFEGPGFHVHQRTYGRFASADKSYTLRQEVSGNADDFGWILGGTYRDFNDINGGRHYGLMKGTGFDEYDADGKFVLRLSEASRLVLAAQHHRTDDAARWHSTNLSKSFHGTTVGTDRQRDFDQERNLYYLQYRWADDRAGFLNAFKASLSWHRQAESETRVLANGDREAREFVVNTPGAWVQAGARTGIGFLTVGGEFYRDVVRSRGHAVLL